MKRSYCRSDDGTVPAGVCREIVIVMRMGEANAYYHIKPIAQVSWIQRVWVLRPNGPIRRLPIEKVAFPAIAGSSIWRKLWSIYREAVRLGKRDTVMAFISFYAVPYGLIAILAGLRTGKPVHLGFVGSDWYRIALGPLGGVLGMLLRRARLITVTGNGMKAEMVARGYPNDRIVPLCHAVDVEAFAVPPPQERPYDILFVGLLIALKRVDLILEAVARIKKTLPGVRACIVGDGVLYSDLRSLRDRLGLAGNVEFVGYQEQTSAYFSGTRTIVIASEREGFPFALVEGICAGAVPVATAVGTIGEFIAHDVNGLLVPPGDATALAGALSLLLTDPVRYARLREGVLAMREGFRMGGVTAQWSEWLTVMVADGTRPP